MFFETCMLVRHHFEKETIMNVKTLIAAVAITLGTTSAFAAGNAPASGEFNMIGNADAALTTASKQTSGLTRAAVIAELKRARADGELAVNGELYGSVVVVKSQDGHPGLKHANVIADGDFSPASGEFSS